jgi:biotin carboxyl carrier protein
MKLCLQVNGDSRDLRVVRRKDRFWVTFEDGREVELRLLSTLDGRFELEHGHDRIHGAGAAIGRKRQVWVNGRTLVYERHGQPEPQREPAGELELSSAIPAVVLEVLVAPGDHVDAGQRLVLLESMKMVMGVQAAHEGTVRAVHCAAGQSVEAGVPLVEVEPTGQAA